MILHTLGVQEHPAYSISPSELAARPSGSIVSCRSKRRKQPATPAFFARGMRDSNLSYGPLGVRLQGEQGCRRLQGEQGCRYGALSAGAVLNHVPLKCSFYWHLGRVAVAVVAVVVIVLVVVGLVVVLLVVVVLVALVLWSF